MDGGTVMIHKSLFIKNGIIDGYGLASITKGVLQVTTKFTIMISHSQFINNEALECKTLCACMQCRILSAININIKRALLKLMRVKN